MFALFFAGVAGLGLLLYLAVLMARHHQIEDDHFLAKDVWDTPFAGSSYLLRVQWVGNHEICIIQTRHGGLSAFELTRWSVYTNTFEEDLRVVTAMGTNWHLDGFPDPIRPSTAVLKTNQ